MDAALPTNYFRRLKCFDWSSFEGRTSYAISANEPVSSNSQQRAPPMKTKAFLSVVVFAFLSVSGIAQADPIQGDLYGIAPGLGNSGGFFPAAGSAVSEAIFDGAGDVIAQDLGGGDIVVTEVLTDNGDGTKTVYIEMVSTSGELFPSGFNDGGGIALDTAGFFMGANMGASPLDFDTPPVLVAGGPFGVAVVLGGFDGSPGADASNLPD